MKLTDLEPEFLRYEGALDPVAFRRIETMEGANGIIFICPKCFHANGFVRPGVHSVVCWAPGVPIGIGLTDPGRWEMKGTSFADLTLVASSSSILLLAGCCAHFFITNGAIIGCGAPGDSY